MDDTRRSLSDTRNCLGNVHFVILGSLSNDDDYHKDNFKKQ